MKYVLGLDGGGTKLMCMLADETGRLVGTSVAGPTNSHFNLPEEIDASITQAISDVLSKHNVDKRDVSVVYGAMPVEKDTALPPIVKNLHDGVSVKLCTEFVMSLYGAIQEDFGALVQAGTGSFAAVRTQRSEKYVGGWGSLLGDEGSGYDIGRKALIACARMEDGRGAYTSLKASVLSHFRQRDMAHIVRLLHGVSAGRQRTLIASLCPLVGRCAGDGDRVALGILEDAAEQLALQAVTVLRQPGVDDGFPLTVAGGVWKTNALLFKRFASIVKQHVPHVNVIPPAFEPVVGGILLGLRDLGFPVKAHMAELRRNFAAFAPDADLFPTESGPSAGSKRTKL